MVEDRKVVADKEMQRNAAFGWKLVNGSTSTRQVREYSGELMNRKNFTFLAKAA